MRVVVQILDDNDKIIWIGEQLFDWSVLEWKHGAIEYISKKSELAVEKSIKNFTARKDNEKDSK